MPPSCVELPHKAFLLLQLRQSEAGAHPPRRQLDLPQLHSTVAPSLQGLDAGSEAGERGVTCSWSLCLDLLSVRCVVKEVVSCWWTLTISVASGCTATALGVVPPAAVSEVGDGGTPSAPAAAAAVEVQAAERIAPLARPSSGRRAPDPSPGPSRSAARGLGSGGLPARPRRLVTTRGASAATSSALEGL
jgi:hypothetical protein